MLVAIEATCEHGNAVLSRYPLGNVELIRHATNSDVWVGSSEQPRLGGRVAVKADVWVGDRILHVYSLHFESGGDADALREAQAHTPYLRIASRLFDTFTGEQEDHQHHNHRSWAVCVECFPLRASMRQSRDGGPRSLFWRFNPRDPRPWIDNDVPGIVAFWAAALELDRPGAL